MDNAVILRLHYIPVKIQRGLYGIGNHEEGSLFIIQIDEFLCHGGNGYGDYIILNVGADGQIEKWRTPAVEMVCDCDEDAQSGWKKLPND